MSPEQQKKAGTKAGYARLRELLNEFDEAKGHFEAGQRELLMGFRSIVDVLIRFAQEGDEEMLRLNVLILIRSGLDFLIAKTPPEEPAQTDEVMIEAYSAILEVLSDEERRIKTHPEALEGDAEKLEALEAIRRVLQVERERASKRADDPDAHKRIRKVEIE
ncbi:MAG: hypothetical protein P9M14_08420 [Candidatus Alcyoniella australis]|nr:hypothetical protein [Candidatus Alcyoniella australis]